jgi:DNA-binding PadR family transcriptional regulator
MEFLTRMEEILLLTVHRLDPEAYGVTIRTAVQELLGKSVSVGAVYVPLDRLAERGYLETSYSDPGARRTAQKVLQAHAQGSDHPA